MHVCDEHEHEPDCVAVAVAVAVGVVVGAPYDFLRRCYLKSYLVPASNPRMLYLFVDCRRVLTLLTICALFV